MPLTSPALLVRSAGGAFERGTVERRDVGPHDVLIDIADWESPEARTTHLAEAMAAGAYGPVLELLAGPFRATVIRLLP